MLQTLLNIAAGWLTFGLHDQAAPILEEARNELLNPNAVKLPPKEYTELARTYVSALGQGPSETGLARITELFRKMDDKKITNTWTTAQFYSRFHLNLVEGRDSRDRERRLRIGGQPVVSGSTTTNTWCESASTPTCADTFCNWRRGTDSHSRLRRCIGAPVHRRKRQTPPHVTP